MEIRVLARQGNSQRRIAALLGISRNTVRHHLQSDASAAPAYPARPARPGKLDPFKSYLLERIAQAKPDWIPATVLLREIRSQGYNGGISQLKDWIRQYRPRPADATPDVRFETPPGEQMQVDFMVCRKTAPRLSAFVATLGHSRMSFVHFLTDETFESVRQGLVRAFEFFGGVPRQVLFDNMKTVVIERDAYGEGRHRYHAGLLQLADEYGFTPRLCRPYRPQTKGKVERFNRYLRYSFYIPLNSQLRAAGLVLDAPTANAKVRQWLDEVANVRIHGALQESPLAAWRREREHLQPLPASHHAARDDLDALAHSVVSRPIPLESVQHPLALYQSLLEPVSTGGCP